jgi:hypothetical protein
MHASQTRSFPLARQWILSYWLAPSRSFAATDTAAAADYGGEWDMPLRPAMNDNWVQRLSHTSNSLLITWSPVRSQPVQPFNGQRVTGHTRFQTTFFRSLKMICLAKRCEVLREVVKVNCGRFQHPQESAHCGASNCAFNRLTSPFISRITFLSSYFCTRTSLSLLKLRDPRTDLENH